MAAIPVPPAGFRGPPPFPNVGGGRVPPAPPNLRPPPVAPGGAGPPPVPRQQLNSIRVSDITPRKIMDEDACKKALTEYQAFTLRKLPPRDAKEKATWAKAEIIKEPLSQDEIAKQVKKLNESKKSVSEKKAELAPYMQGQLTRLLDEIRTNETDQNFEWSLAQIDRKIQQLKGAKQKETATMTAFVKRCPSREVNPCAVYEALERIKRERMANLVKPPAPPAGATEIIDIGKDKKDRHKKYHSDSSSSSGYGSGSDSGSDYSSTQGTSISSRSGRHIRRYRRRGRSYSRHRDHKKYYLTDRVHSPDRFRDPYPYGTLPPRYAVPEVPHAIPAYDPVGAAYEAGRADRDAEVSYSPPLIGKAIVTYGRPEPRIYDERYVVDDPYARRRHDAEEYIEVRSPRPVYDNPFYPRYRRHPPSIDDW